MKMQDVVKTSEDDLQAGLIEVATLCGFLAYHTHDSRKSAEGFPDVVLVQAREDRMPRTMFIELKSGEGRPTGDQIKWLDALSREEDGTAWPVNEVYLLRPKDWDSGLINRLLDGERAPFREWYRQRENEVPKKFRKGGAMKKKAKGPGEPTPGDLQKQLAELREKMAGLFPGDLRDRFAEAALPGLVGLTEYRDHLGTKILWKPARIAKQAYAIADAMMAERKREGGNGE